MKRILFSLSLIFLLFHLSAQITFCPKGAQWRYRFEQRAMGTIQHNYSIRYQGDTIVSGDTLKVLSYNSFSWYAELQPPPYIAFIKQRGDTIFMRSVWTGDQWQILYNYAALPGQSWINTFQGGTKTFTTTVNAVDTVILNSKAVRRLKVTYTSNLPTGSYQGYISEHIGSSDYLFNYKLKLSYDVPEYREFLCYSDNTLGTIKFGTKPCNYSDELGLNNLTHNLNLKIYPNPFNDRLFIESDEAFVLSLTDINGRLVIQPTLHDKTINTSELYPGIYLLQVYREKELIYTHKLIKAE